jgi:hypothetical protein
MMNIASKTVYASILSFLLVFSMFSQFANATPSTWSAPAYGNSGDSTELFGVQIMTKAQTHLISIGRKTGDTATTCYLYSNASVPALLETESFVGDICTMTYVLANNTAYNVIIGTGSSTYTKKQLYPLGGYTLPDTSDPNINIIQRAGCTYGTNCNDVTQWDMSANALENIANITTDNNPTSPTSTTLYINGATNNVSQSYGSSDNITAVSNITGLYVTIFRNNSIDVNTTSATENIILPVGYWNITGFTNTNASYSSSSATLFANISQAGQSISLTGITNNTYPYSVTPVCSGNVTSDLYRNNAVASNNSAIQLGVGTYTWICNTTTNANYTFNSATATQVVSQATPTLSLTFNTSSSVNQGVPVLISCSDTTSLNLYNDSSAISNPYTLTTTSLSGVFNYTCNTTGNANYTSGTTSKSLTINVIPPTTSGNASIIYDIASMIPNNVSCLDNYTLQQIYLEPNITRDINCPSGCDSVSNACDPPEWQQNLEVFIVFIVIIICGVIFLNWVRKR